MCDHKRTVMQMMGGIHLVYGEYDDDLTLAEYCLDCGEVLWTEAQEPADNFDPVSEPNF